MRAFGLFLIISTLIAMVLAQASLSPTSTPTPSPDPTETPSNSPSFTPSVTVTVTPSVTNSLTPSVTNSITPSVTDSVTNSVTVTVTRTATITSTDTETSSSSVTGTGTGTGTGSNTITPSVTLPPICGDGVVETGEQCDPGFGNFAKSSCCNTNCQFKNINTKCGAATNDCFKVPRCRGSATARVCGPSKPKRPHVHCKIGTTSGKCDGKGNCL